MCQRTASDWRKLPGKIGSQKPLIFQSPILQRWEWKDLNTCLEPFGNYWPPLEGQGEPQIAQNLHCPFASQN